MALIRLGFRVSLGLEDLRRAKKSKGYRMEKQAIKQLMYGGIKELMNDRRYFYNSGMGRKYSHWTEEGRLAIYEFVSDISVYITDAENAELDQRAKDMVLKELKGN
jgi:predicted GIY-YIG superfamily endonuclease